MPNGKVVLQQQPQSQQQQKGPGPDAVAGPKGLVGNTNNFANFNKAESKHNTCDGKPNQKPDVKRPRSAPTKPGACTTESKEATPPTGKNTDRKKHLKSNRGLRSWNRMTKNPPKLLLSDPDVRRWHDNLRRSSALTGNVRLRRLNIFCERVGMTPRQLIQDGRDDPMRAENVLLDHVSWMEEKSTRPDISRE